jgi:hypothetical protein
VPLLKSQNVVVFHFLAFATLHQKAFFLFKIVLPFAKTPQQKSKSNMHVDAEIVVDFEFGNGTNNSRDQFRGRQEHHILKTIQAQSTTTSIPHCWPRPPPVTATEARQPQFWMAQHDPKVRFSWQMMFGRLLFFSGSLTYSHGVVIFAFLILIAPNIMEPEPRYQN